MRGHIRKRGNKWVVVVDVGYDQNGRRKQRWHSGFDTKRDASKEPHRETVAQFMARWLDSIRATIRPTTWEAYRTLTEVHIVPRLGAIEE